MKDMTKQEIIDSLKGYKDGTYGGPMKAVMTPQVAGLSDADIQAIAEKIGK
jgi:cytochrome c553